LKIDCASRDKHQKKNREIATIRKRFVVDEEEKRKRDKNRNNLKNRP
jgi:hypothetical protein